MENTVFRHHGSGGVAPEPPMSPPAGGGHHARARHTTFFWGTHAEVLFSGWPDRSAAMYALSLVSVFLLSALVELFSHFRRRLITKPGASGVALGFFQTAMHAIRSGLMYMVVLAVMSFNGGIFIAAVVGHAVGFAIFGTNLFWRTRGSGGSK